MAYTATVRLGLQKAVPNTNQPFETTVFNENWDAIDSEAVATDARLDAIEAIDITQNLRLSAVESLSSTFQPQITSTASAVSAIDTRVSSVETTLGLLSDPNGVATFFIDGGYA
jgi:hypothetical protein